MNTRHTPGPWVPNPLMLDQICTYGGEPTVVAYAYRDMPADIVIANANLIAAAPELLAALKNLAASFDPGTQFSELAAARAAIAKATGSAE